MQQTSYVHDPKINRPLQLSTLNITTSTHQGSSSLLNFSTSTFQQPEAGFALSHAHTETQTDEEVKLPMSLTESEQANYIEILKNAMREILS